MISQRRKTVLAIAGMATLSLVLMIPVELTLRSINKPSILNIAISNPHGTGSYRLKPNVKLKTEIEGQLINVITNPQGMRWRPVSKERKENQRRIAIVGDSFTFGCWANIEDSFVGVADARLKDKDIEVLNFGIGGYGFADIELQIGEEVLQYEPDIVVLASFNGNDFRDTYLGLNRFTVTNGVALWNRETLLSKVPAELLRKDLIDERMDEDAFELVASENKSLKRWMYENCYTFRAALNVKRRIFNKAGAGSAPVFFTPSLEVRELFTDSSFWSVSNYPPIAIDAVEVSLTSLERIEKQLKERGIKFYVVTIPYREQIYVEELVGAGYDLNYPQKHVEDFCRSNNIPYLDLLPFLRKQVRETQEMIYFAEGHFNARGHRLAGRQIADWVINATHPVNK